VAGAAGGARRLHPQQAPDGQPVAPPARGADPPVEPVLKAISDALNLSAETLLAQAGLIDAVTVDPAPGDIGEADASVPQTEDAIRADGRLTEEQKAALIAVYRSMLN
jgi:hypothetical protein